MPRLTNAAKNVHATKATKNVFITGTDISKFIAAVCTKLGNRYLKDCSSPHKWNLITWVNLQNKIDTEFVRMIEEKIVTSDFKFVCMDIRKTRYLMETILEAKSQNRHVSEETESEALESFIRVFESYSTKTTEARYTFGRIKAKYDQLKH